MTVAELRGDAVILACGIGAGVLAALGPVAAAVVFGGVVLWLTHRSTTNERNAHVNASRASRPIPLALTVLVGLFSALVALAVTGGHDAAAHGTDDRHASVAAAADTPVVTPRLVAFHDEMRRLWEDHVTWTRLAIISLIGETPDTEATVGRLLENQADIGDAIKPFYGDAAGEELTTLLREHILIAADIIAAAKAGDQAALTAAQARWTTNADEIAAFLAGANPRSWDLNEMKTMLHEHLRLTTNEAVARLQGDWAADVTAYDEIHVQALGMADMLSNGIVKQFPGSFR